MSKNECDRNRKGTHTHSSKPSQIDIEEGRKGISTKSVELNAENETEKK